MPVAISMGALHAHESGCQTAHRDGLARQHSAVVHIDDGKSYDTDILDVLIPEAGAFYVMDRGFFDLQRLHRLAQAAAFFVIRTKTNLQFRRVYSHAVSKESGVMGRSDHRTGRQDIRCTLSRSTQAGKVSP
jgi:Transposase DDE domain